MNSNQIRCFLSVGKTLSFTQSAQELFLSQSTISKNIKNLDAELNVKLLDRSHQQVKLTAKGEIFFNQMLKINQEIENLIIKVQTQDSEILPTVYLGYMDITFEEIYLPVAIRLINQHLNIELRMRIVDPSSTIKLSDLLKRKNLDFLIYQKDYFVNDKSIGFYPLLKKGFSVLANRDDPLYFQDNASISDFENRNIWVWNTGELLPTVDKLINEIKASGINCSIHEISDSMVLTDYVQSNNGIGLVPSILYDKNMVSLRYVPLKENIPIYYGIAYLKETESKNYFRKVINSFDKAVDISKNKW